MLKSMTSYGQSSSSTPLGKLLVEIQSVNRRYLEIQCNLTPVFSKFENKIRSFLTKNFSRGHIQIKVSLVPIDMEYPSLNVNQGFLKQLILAWRDVAKSSGHSDNEPLPLDLFKNHPQLFINEIELYEDDKFWPLLLTGLETALEPAIDFRLKEGQVLQEDLLKRCNKLKNLTEDIKRKAQEIPNKYRERLKERLESVIQGSVENDERMIREVFLYAEKVDITEECVRLNAHLDKLEKLLTIDQPCVGKELDFLLQEIGREINTAGAKSPDVDVTHLILEMKNEAEKVREQVQNIE